MAAFSVGLSPRGAQEIDTLSHDNVRGGVLDSDCLRHALREEFDWCHRRGVWEEIPRFAMDGGVKCEVNRP
eukprot:12179569-Prorocentrum_lima.AAC.1